MLRKHVILLLFVSAFSDDQREGPHETAASEHDQFTLYNFSAVPPSEHAQHFFNEHVTPDEPRKAAANLSPPANVTVTATCDSHVVATWFYPDDPSTSFWVQLCMEGVATCQKARASHDARTFSFDVDPTENTYKFSIWASKSTPNEEVNSTAVAVNVTTFPNNIGPVRNLKHVVINVTVIFISWQEPAGSSGISGYAITCENKAGSQSASADLPPSRQVNASLDLKLQLANFTCTVNAFAETSSGRQDGNATTFDVMTDGIEAPRDVTLLNATETTLTYSWRADPTAGKYRISVKALSSNRTLVNFHENQLQQPDAVSVKHTVFGLIPGTFYEVSVQNCADYCGLPTVVTDTTEVAAPSQVLNLTSSLEGYLNVSLMWMRPQETNGPIDGYVINILNKDNNRTEDHYIPGDLLNFSFRLWEQFSYFKASVSPYNVDHYRNVTLFGLQQSTEFTTLGEENLTVDSRNSTWLLLKWQRPQAPNGPISGYKVTWTDGEDTCASVTTEQSLNCTHLKPDTLYKISVYAFNDDHRERKSGPASILEASTESGGKRATMV
ncbi:hypothetical protein V5799_021755 [Amblyomma americanum]|uniref:Fibronectin type-III domain-containing protein n=1 Tax=Amblyomma americanum TaxID=6943 RepID=A0AAQ4FP17_AMBAM